MQATTRRLVGTTLSALWFTSATAAPADGQALDFEEVNRLHVLEESASDFAVAVSAHGRGDLDAAIYAYGTAIEKDPNFVEAIVNLARAFSDQGSQTEADEWLDEALRLRSDYYALHKVRGLVSLRRGEPARSVESFTRALRLQPNDAESLTNLGTAFLELGRMDRAIEVLERAALLAPDNSETVLNLAVSHDRASEPGRAAYHYERFLKISARNDPLRDAVQSRLEQLDDNATRAVSAGPPAQPADASTSQSQNKPRRTP